MQQVFTTSEVALICKVAERTVNKWFDSGRLRGYRLPGTQDRRIPRDHLIRFLKEHGMPLGDLEKAEEGQETTHPMVSINVDVHPESIIAKLDGLIWTCVRANNLTGVFGQGITPDQAFHNLVSQE